MMASDLCYTSLAGAPVRCSPLMMLLRFLILHGVLLPSTVGMTVKQPQPSTPPASGENAMANTYGFLRTASNNVGNTVEGVLGVEGSLTDMKKDLDKEYDRWMKKKKVLLAERDKLKSQKARANGVLLEQKQMQEEKKRVAGDVAAQQADNKKQEAANKEKAAKIELDKKGMDEDIEALKCHTKTIQQAKQDRVDAANQKTSVLKDQNRVLQDAVFRLNKEVTNLGVEATKEDIQHKDTKSGLLAKVEALQNQIHGLEKQLVAQAQLEETVDRARERLAAQTAQTVQQREKLTAAQSKCMANRNQMTSDIEAAKRNLNDANVQMMQCQNLDGENQKLQAELNACMVTKRSTR
jgi:chromosome segregation ATPase